MAMQAMGAPTSGGFAMPGPSGTQSAAGPSSSFTARGSGGSSVGRKQGETYLALSWSVSIVLLIPPLFPLLQIPSQHQPQSSPQSDVSF